MDPSGPRGLAWGGHISGFLIFLCCIYIKFWFTDPSQTPAVQNRSKWGEISDPSCPDQLKMRQNLGPQRDPSGPQLFRSGENEVKSRTPADPGVWPEVAISQVSRYFSIVFISSSDSRTPARPQLFRSGENEAKSRTPADPGVRSPQNSCHFDKYTVEKYRDWPAFDPFSTDPGVRNMTCSATVCI